MKQTSKITDYVGLYHINVTVVCVEEEYVHVDKNREYLKLIFNY